MPYSKSNSSFAVSSTRGRSQSSNNNRKRGGNRRRRGDNAKSRPPPISSDNVPVEADRDTKEISGELIIPNETAIGNREDCSNAEFRSNTEEDVVNLVGDDGDIILVAADAIVVESTANSELDGIEIIESNDSNNCRIDIIQTANNNGMPPPEVDSISTGPLPIHTTTIVSGSSEAPTKSGSYVLINDSAELCPDAVVPESTPSPQEPPNNILIESHQSELELFAAYNEAGLATAAAISFAAAPLNSGRSSTASNSSTNSSVDTIIMSKQPVAENQQSLIERPHSLREQCCKVLSDTQYGACVLQELANISEELKGMLIGNDHITNRLSNILGSPISNVLDNSSSNDTEQCSPNRKIIKAAPATEESSTGSTDNVNPNRLLSIIRESSSSLSSFDTVASPSHSADEKRDTGRAANLRTSNEVEVGLGILSSITNEFKNISRDEVSSNYFTRQQRHPPPTASSATTTADDQFNNNGTESIEENTFWGPREREATIAEGTCTRRIASLGKGVGRQPLTMMMSSVSDRHRPQHHQLSEMHKKRRSLLEEGENQSREEQKIGQRRLRRRLSLPYELHANQLQYIMDSDRDLFGAVGGPVAAAVMSQHDILNKFKTEADLFREQMHNEWMAKIAERDQRRQAKVMKLHKPAIVEEDAVVATGGSNKPIASFSMENEFLDRVQRRRNKLKLSDDDYGPRTEETEELIHGTEKMPVKLIDGEMDIVGNAKELPKHLQEFADAFVNLESITTAIADLCNDCEGGEAVMVAMSPTFKAKAPQPGIWSPATPTPSSKHGDRLFGGPCRDDEEDNNSINEGGDNSLERDVYGGGGPIWTPRSAQSTPNMERKHYRPVHFQSPQMQRKFTNLNAAEHNINAATPIPPWEAAAAAVTTTTPPESSQYRNDKFATSDHLLHQQQQQQRIGNSTPSSVRRIAQSFSAPKLNSTTLTASASATTAAMMDNNPDQNNKSNLGWDKPNFYAKGKPEASSGGLIGGGMLEYTKSSGQQQYREATMTRGSTGAVTKEELNYDNSNNNAEIGPGGGPPSMTNDGMPITLRSEVRDNHQSNWYKQVYNTIHRHPDDGFLTVRYKTRRGAPYKSSGYLSEPEHHYDSDYYSSTATNKPVNSYRVSPGRIADYTPGQLPVESPKGKQRRPIKASYTQGNLSRALNEQGYESESSLLFRRNDKVAAPLSATNQKQAYLQVQAGGDAPLQGFRKPVPLKAKESDEEECQIYKTASITNESPRSLDLHSYGDADSELSISCGFNKDILCYPITNISRPLNMFGEFPKDNRVFIPPTPPIRKESTMCKSILFSGASTSIAMRKSERHSAIGRQSKEEKEIANANKTQSLSSKIVKPFRTVCLKRSPRPVSAEPRRSSPSPVAFGRSISKERTFAEEKKRLEKISPQCKKMGNLTTRILKKSDVKSSDDLRKAIHKAVIKRGQDNSTLRVTKVSATRHDSRSVGYLTRSTRTDSSLSLARTSSTFSIDSVRKSSKPIKKALPKEITKDRVRKDPEINKKNVSYERKVATVTVSAKKPRPKTIVSQKQQSSKCRPVSVYLSNKQPVTNSKFKQRDDAQSLIRPRMVVRSNSLPKNVTTSLIESGPTVIPAKPFLMMREARLAYCTTNSLGRANGCRAKSAGASEVRYRMDGIDPNGNNISDKKLSYSTSALNVIEKHSSMCRYRNSDRFQELNQFFTKLERMAYLEKVTSQSDLRPIRKQAEIIDYDLWKKIRTRDKAQRELSYITNQLKHDQKEKKLQFQVMDVDQLRWNRAADSGLKRKEKSVEDLRGIFACKMLTGGSQKPSQVDKKLACEKSTAPPPPPPSIIQMHEKFGDKLGLSHRLVSTLSRDQVAKLKTQLNQIYSSEPTASGKTERVVHSNVVRAECSAAHVQRSQSLLTRSESNSSPFSSLVLAKSSNLSDQDKRKWASNLCVELKSMLDKRRNKSLEHNRTGNETAANNALNKGIADDIKEKIDYFEKQPLVVPGAVIYHAREDVEAEEFESLSNKQCVPKAQENFKRSHSFSDLKEIFGERQSSTSMHQCTPPRSMSPHDMAGQRRQIIAWKERSMSNENFVVVGEKGDSPKTCEPNEVVPWIAHKLEIQNALNTSSRSRCRKRKIISPPPRSQKNTRMPHIDVISKTALLSTRRHKSVPIKCETGNVQKIRHFFESRDHRMSSILGEMYTSEPDIAKLKDATVYLSGSWVAHRYPKAQDNNMKLEDPKDVQKDGASELSVLMTAAAQKTKSRQCRATRSLGGDENRKWATLKSIIFPYKFFDEDKWQQRLPFNTTSSSSRRKKAFNQKLEEDGTAAVVKPPPPPAPPVKATAEPPQPPSSSSSLRYDSDYYDDTSRQYIEGNVNIHYKSPICHEFKGIIPEAELSERQADAMRALYEQEKQRKHWQELEDLKSRRHTDNFTPSQKSPISAHRFDDFVGIEGSAKPKKATLARALYEFRGQTARELSFNKGDIINIRRQVDDHWYEGEHNAFFGLFPCTYVEIISGPIAAKPKKPVEGLARAKYNFVAQSGIELSLNKGELVALTRQVDENWFEGRIANRKGIIPISYCEVLTPIETFPATTVVRSTSALSVRQQPDSKTTTTKTEILHVDTTSEPIAYRAIFKYLPQNTDELELFEGDVVFVLEKCDDGWFVGTSERSGCFGTFPGNYVERI